MNTLTSLKPKSVKFAPASDLNASDLDAASEQDAPTLLERVQAAWQQQQQISGNGSWPYAVSQAVAKVLTEIEDCMDALGFAEQAMRQQNDALEAAQHALREERLHYQSLVRALPYAVLVTDTQGIIRAVNVSAADLLGVNARYLIGKSFALYARQSERTVLLRVLTQMLVTEGWILRTRKGLPAAYAKSSTIKNEQGVTTGLLWLLQVSGSLEVSGPLEVPGEPDN